MLKDKLKEDVKNAMKAHNQEVVGVLRLALAGITTKETEKRYKIAKEKPDLAEEALVRESLLTDEEIISSLSSEIKKRKDAIVLYEQGGRPELAENEKKEIAILQPYLPEQLSLDEIKKLVAESIATTGATSIKEMGKVMADVSQKIKGRAEGAQVSAVVKELLK